MKCHLVALQVCAQYGLCGGDRPHWLRRGGRGVEESFEGHSWET